MNLFQQANSDHGVYLMKCSKEKISVTLFWIGVPVRHHLKFPFSSYTAFEVCIIRPLI